MQRERSLTAIPVIVLLAAALLSGCDARLPLRADPSSSDRFELTELRSKADQAYAGEDWEQAIEYLERLTGHDPEDTESWYRLGNAYAHLKQSALAIDAYREVLIRDPRNGKVWHNMGIVQLRETTNTFARMQEYLDPDDPLSRRAQDLVNGISDLIGREVETREDQ